MGGTAPEQLPSLGGSIALSFASLALVCLLAYVALRWLSRRGVGRSTGPLEVLARCALEPRRSVYLVRAGGRCFLVGVGDGPMALLAELDEEAVNSSIASRTETPAEGFASVLARVLGPKRDGQ